MPSCFICRDADAGSSGCLSSTISCPLLDACCILTNNSHDLRVAFLASLPMPLASTRLLRSLFNFSTNNSHDLTGAIVPNEEPHVHLGLIGLLHLGLIGLLSFREENQLSLCEENQTPGSRGVSVPNTYDRNARG